MLCSKPFRFLLVLCSVVVLSGCSGSYSLVAFEVLEPGKLIFPENVSQLLILNRLPASHRMFDKKEIGDLGTGQLLMLDTLISNNIFLGLYDVLSDSPIRNFHWPTWSSERQPELMVKNDIILMKREVSELCLKNNSDVILSLEAFHLDIRDQPYRLLTGTNLLYGVQLISKSTWFVYLPESPRPYDEFEVLDTMAYSAWRDIQTPRPFPSNEMIKQISHRSGTTYGRHITPVWEKTESKGHFCISDVVLEGSLPDELKEAAEMFAGCVSGAVKKSDYLATIEEQGFSELIIHKEKQITIPDEILANYLSAGEIEAAKKGEFGIFSITVNATKPISE